METGLLKKVWHLSSVVKRINLIVIFLLMIFLSLLELISIGIVIPYIDFISGNVNINNVLNSVGLSLNYSISKDNVTIYASVLILLVFIVKSIVAIFLKYKVVKFSHHVMLRHRGYFIDSYLKQNFSQFSKRNSSEYIHAIQTMTSHYSGSVLRPILMLAGEIVVAIVIVTYLIFMYKFQIIFLSKQNGLFNMTR